MTEPEPNMMSDLQEMTPELAREIAQDLVNAAGFELTAVITDPADGYTAIDLQGNDTGYLTARQGEALNAFQHLLCLMVSRATGERARIVVDAAGVRVDHLELHQPSLDDVFAEATGRRLEGAEDVAATAP